MYECDQNFVHGKTQPLHSNSTYFVLFNKSNRINDFIDLLKYNFIDLNVLANVVKLYDKFKNNIIAVQGYKKSSEIMRYIMGKKGI